MRKLTLSAIIVLVAIDLVGQDFSSKLLKLNLQQNFNQEDQSSGFSIAPVLMHKTSKNNYHEFELSTISLKRYEDDFYNSSGATVSTDVNEFRLGVRYQYTLMFMKKSGNRFFNRQDWVWVLRFSGQR